MEGLICGCGSVLEDLLCKSKCVINRAQIDAQLHKLDNLIASANDLMKLGDRLGTIRLLDVFMTVANCILEKDNALRLVALIPLMNAHVSLGNLPQAHQAAVQALMIMERCGPLNWPEKLDLIIQVSNLSDAIGLKDEGLEKKGMNMEELLFGRRPSRIIESLN